MGESKQRKAIDDMYGMSKLPESARPFVLTMQEAVEPLTGATSHEINARIDHQFFFDGALNGEHGVYDIGIPTELFDFSEYAFTASIYALTGFMGVTRFGMVMRSPIAEHSNVVMMLACIDGVWFYNTIKAIENGTPSIPGIGDWRQAQIKDLAVAEQSNRFMTTMTDILKRSRSQQDNVKAMMTLEYLKEHYRAVLSTSRKSHSGGEVSIN